MGFTDWSVVRRMVGADLGQDPSDGKVEAFMQKAYDTDFSAASSIDESAVALQEHYGFSPANAQWEAYAQGRQGATMLLKVADGTDFGILADNLRTTGYRKPKDDDGVWKGGADLVAGIDPTITPQELQYVVLLEDQGLVVASDSASYAALAADAARGDRDSLASTGKVDGLDNTLGRPANAMLLVGRLRVRGPRDVAGRRGRPDPGRRTRRAGGGRLAGERACHGDAGEPDPAGGGAVRER